MTVPWHILIVSSDLESRRVLTMILNRQGFDPICTSSINECQDIMAHENVGLVFCDRHLADGSYHDLLMASHRMKCDARVVVTSPHPDWDHVQARRLGAFDVIYAPCRPTDVEWMLIQAKRDDRNKLQETKAS